MEVKIATSKSEFEQIHRLNYKTFVEEIPQHNERADERLVDMFHGKSTYLIAVDMGKVIGMICYNVTRPFSLEKKNVVLDAYIPAGTKPVEIRLLTVDKSWRKTKVTYELIKTLIINLKKEGVQIGFISAITYELSFYNKMGFIPFGGLVGKKDAYYQPMYLTFDILKKSF